MNRVKICFRSLLLSFALCLPLLSGCGANTTGNAISKSGFYFNTVIQVTIYDSSRESALEGCFDLAAEYEGYFSNTIADSDISQINENAGTPVTVHDETIELLERAIYYGDLSGGKFDVTLGNLSDLWDFSTKALIDTADASMIPSDDEIQALLPAIDYHSIQISGNEVTLTDPDAKIDLAASPRLHRRQDESLSKRAGCHRRIYQLRRQRACPWCQTRWFRLQNRNPKTLCRVRRIHRCGEDHRPDRCLLRCIRALLHGGWNTLPSSVGCHHRVSL